MIANDRHAGEYGLLAVCGGHLNREKKMELIQALLANWQEIAAAGVMVLGAVAGLLAALYTLFLLIPGEQPDKTIKGILEFTKRFSRK